MAFSAALLAAERRLLGASRQHIPLLPHAPTKPDAEEALFAAGRNTVVIPVTTRAPGSAPVAGKHVPVLFHDQDGKDWRTVYPSFTFRFTAFAPRLRDWKGTHEGYPIHHPTRMIPSTSADDAKGPMLYARRVPAEPWDMTLELRAYSLDAFESSLMVRHILRQFRVRDFLRVPHNDGTYRAWQVLHAGYEDKDGELVSLTRGADEQVYYKVITYLLEGYLDSSDLEQIGTTVKRVDINLSRK